MINYGAIVLSFIAGYYLHKNSEKIVFWCKQMKFFLQHYKEITGSKTYNDFYEDYISQKDFCKESDINE